MNLLLNLGGIALGYALFYGALIGVSAILKARRRAHVRELLALRRQAEMRTILDTPFPRDLGRITPAHIAQAAANLRKDTP